MPVFSPPSVLTPAYSMLRPLTPACCDGWKPLHGPASPGHICPHLNKVWHQNKPTVGVRKGALGWELRTLVLDPTLSQDTPCSLLLQRLRPCSQTPPSAAPHQHSVPCHREAGAIALGQRAWVQNHPLASVSLTSLYAVRIMSGPNPEEAVKIKRDTHVAQATDE